MMGWNHGGWGAGGWLVMSFVMLIFWVAVIALVIWFVRNARSSPGPSGPSPRPGIATDSAHALLADRFARGEIDEAEFVRSRALLHSPSS